MDNIEGVHEMWQSGFDIFDWAGTVPEVVGGPYALFAVSEPPEQVEHTPRPRCKAVGYTYIEWLKHWRKALGRTIMSAPDEELQDSLRSMVRRCKKRGKSEIY